MAEIRVGKNETLDSALRRFKRSCQKAGVLSEVRKREHYEKPSVRRKKKSEKVDTVSLKEELSQDMKSAMKKKEAGKIELAVIRSVRSSIKNVEIDGKCELDDAGVSKVIAKEMKQRKESLEDFVKGGREDLAAQVRAEIAVLEKYMPAQLSSEEVFKIVSDIVAGMGEGALKMGDVMKAVMPQLQGEADGKVISDAVKKTLQSR